METTGLVHSSIESALATARRPWSDGYGSAVPVVVTVDANVALRDLCVAVLETRGYRAFGFASAEDALAFVDARSDVAVVMTALELGGKMSGRQLVEHLQIGRPGVAVVVVSSVLGAVPEIPGVAALTKPFGIKELLNVVGGASRRHHAAEIGELISADCWD